MVSIHAHSHCVGFRNDLGTIIGINKHNARNVCIRPPLYWHANQNEGVTVSSSLFSLSLRLISRSHAAPISAAVGDYIHPVKEKKKCFSCFSGESERFNFQKVMGFIIILITLGRGLVSLFDRRAALAQLMSWMPE